MMMPCGFRVVVEKFDHVQMRRAVDRIAADADAGGLADAARSELPDRLVGQRAAARDDADVSFFVNVAGRDADAAAAVRILALAGRDDAGTVRPDEPRLGVACSARFTRIMSRTGMPSVMATTSSSPASAPSRMASAANGGGTNTALAVAPVCFTASATVSKIGHFFAAVLEKLAAFAGRDAGDDLRAVINRELRVFRAKAAGDALDENLGVGFNENGHDKIYDFRFSICDFKTILFVALFVL